MARYIDVDKARIYVSDFVCEQMKKIPIADVVEVKRGKWVSAPIKEKGYDSKTIPTCTNCGYQSFITYTFCPECGARLKENETKNDR